MLTYSKTRVKCSFIVSVVLHLKNRQGFHTRNGQKIQQIAPMVQGYSIQKPVISLQRCNEQFYRGTTQVNEDLNNSLNDCDRLAPIYEEPDSEDNVGEMEPDPVHFAGSERQRRSRLGRRGCQSSSYNPTSLFRNENDTDAASPNRIGIRNSRENYSAPVLEDTINVRRMKTSPNQTSPGCSRESEHRHGLFGGREAVVKLNKLENDINHNLSSNAEQESECQMVGIRCKDVAQICEQDPLEGTSTMYIDCCPPLNHTRSMSGNKFSENNVIDGGVVYDEDELENDSLDDDLVETTPELRCSKNRKLENSKFSSLPKNKHGRKIISSKSHNESSSKGPASDNVSCFVVCENISKSPKFREMMESTSVERLDSLDEESINTHLIKNITERPKVPSFLGFTSDEAEIHRSSIDNLQKLITVIPTNSGYSTSINVAGSLLNHDKDNDDELPLNVLKKVNNLRSNKKRTNKKNVNHENNCATSEESVVDVNIDDITRNSSPMVQSDFNADDRSFSSITKRAKVVKLSSKSNVMNNSVDAYGSTKRLRKSRGSHEPDMSIEMSGLSSMGSVYEDADNDQPRSKRRTKKNVSYALPSLVKKLRRS